MKRIYALCLLVLPLLTSCESMPSMPGGKDALISSLTSTLGLTENQAQGGVGSILTLAQEKLVAGDFDKIASVIPGADAYLAKAKELGAVIGPIGDVNGLNGALGRLGIDQATAEKLVPAVKDLVGRLGGEEVGNLLGGVLGG